MAEKERISKYMIIRCIGQGGEGCVYLAKDEELQRFVAVKKIGMRQGENKNDDRMLQEADILRQLCHPMLPVIYELLWDGNWYLVMEYIHGVTMQRYIEQNGCAGEEQARTWAGQLLDILQYLHTQKPPVIYRDLKPQNVIVCPEGNLRLIDFGAAYRRSFGGRGNRMAATPGYGAPEQFGKKGMHICADERSDIYALGMLLYYMVTGADPGKPPYALLPVQDYQPLLGQSVEQVIRRCTKEEPLERYQTVEEIREDLNREKRRRIYRPRRGGFIRRVEKRVWLTEWKSIL